MVIANNAAVGLGLRTTAAQRVQAVALSLFGRTELVNEFAVLEVATTLAIVVNGLAEDLRGFVLGVELGQLAQQQVLDEHRAEPLGVRRAARDVDDGHVDALLLEERLHALRVRRVGSGGHPAAIDGARAERDNRGRLFGGLDQVLIAGFASNAKCIAVPTVEHGAFIHQNVVAGFDGLFLGLFHRMARSSGQGLAVVERNELEHDGGSVGSVDLSESLGATRARSALDPDDRVQVALACADNRLLPEPGPRAERRLHPSQP